MLTHVFAYTRRRDEVARFFEETLGVVARETKDDSAWFASSNGATLVVHDREDEPQDAGFVPWFHVSDLDGSFERARARGATVGGMRDGYFFARDPDGRVVGVRAWR